MTARHETPGGRRQVKFQVAREAGRIRQIEIEQVRLVGGVSELDQILRLDRHGAQRLIDVVTALQHVPVEGVESSVRIDDQKLRYFFADPDAMVRLYEREPQRIRELIESDASANDVVALAHRRAVVERFRELLTDEEAFAEAEGEEGGPERVWQHFLEANPWILGISLAAQLLTSWDASRLEQFVAGSSVAGPGKRVDALLETSGRIRALVFAEIKHHRTELLAARHYRSGSWPPSTELTGAVVQAQQTVDLAVHAIGSQLRDKDEEGAETSEAVHVVRPRSFVVAGQLDQLRGASGVHTDKYRSFELYRRNLYEPEIVTFDECSRARSGTSRWRKASPQPTSDRTVRRTAAVAGRDAREATAPPLLLSREPGGDSWWSRVAGARASVPLFHKSSTGEGADRVPTRASYSSAAVANSVFPTPRWCLGSAHLPARVTSDDESVGSAGERASRGRELLDRS